MGKLLAMQPFSYSTWLHNFLGVKSPRQTKRNKGAIYLTSFQVHKA